MNKAGQNMHRRFTKEQIAEQAKFRNDLKNGNAKFAFSGTFKDGIDFLKVTGKLVDAFNHS